VLKSMDRENRERLEQVLSYPEDSAGRLMNPDVVTVRADVTVDVVLRYLRLRGELPDHTDHLYVTSRRHQYLGRRRAVAHASPTSRTRQINELLTTIRSRFVTVDDLERRGRAVLRPRLDHGAGGRREQRPARPHHHRRRGRHHPRPGRTPGDERGRPERGRRPVQPGPRAVRRRLVWLGVNLGTAFLAASVVGRSKARSRKLVALAILMPIVAGMGGNAGTQVLALMIRGLALGQVSASNVAALLWKELRVALINGMVLGTVLGIASSGCGSDPALSAVIASALTLNLLSAASAGVLVPMTLKRLGFDPALAGGVILTTVTDVMGFLAFLGLGTVFLL
jgi:magnesium transporter